MAGGSKKGIEAGRAYVKGYWDDSLITRGLRRTRSMLNKTAGAMLSMGGAAMGVAAGLTAAFAGTVKAAGEMAATLASFDTIFKDQAGAVGKWADDLAKRIGRSATEVRGFLTGTQARFAAMEGMDPRQAASMNMAMTERAYDLAAFFDKDDATAMQAMQNALTGEMEMLKQFGVVISAADTDAKLKSMGLDPRTASQSEKAQARFALVMQRTASVTGTALREAGEYGSMLKRLQANVRDAAEAIGIALLPYVVKLMGWMSQAVQYVTDLAKRFPQVTLAVASAIPILGGLGGVLVAAGAAIVGVTSTFSALAAVAGTLSVPVMAVVAAATALYGALGYVAYQSGLLGQVWGVLKEQGTQLFGDATAGLKAFAAALQGGNLGAAVEALWLGFKLGFIDVIEAIVETWKTAIKGMAAYAVEALKNAVTLGGTGSDDGPGLFASLGLGDSREQMRKRLAEIQQEFARRDPSPRHGSAPAGAVVAGGGFNDPALSRTQAESLSNAARARQEEEADVYAKAMLAERNRQAQAKFEAQEERRRQIELEKERLFAEADSLAGQLAPRVQAIAAGANRASVANTSQGADVLGRALGMGVGVTDGDKMIVGQLQRIEKAVRQLETEDGGII